MIRPNSTRSGNNGAQPPSHALFYNEHQPFLKVPVRSPEQRGGPNQPYAYHQTFAAQTPRSPPQAHFAGQLFTPEYQETSPRPDLTEELLQSSQQIKNLHSIIEHKTQENADLRQLLQTSGLEKQQIIGQ